MTKHSLFHLPGPGRRGAAALLASFMLTGFLLGAWFSRSAGEDFSRAMGLLARSGVSLAGVLASMTLPLLVSALAVYVGRPLLMIPVALCKAFSFSAIACGLASAWGSAGWLVSGLAMFSSVCAMPVLCWYWLRQLDCREFRPVPFAAALGVLILLGILDDCLILPFLAAIITY